MTLPSIPKRAASSGFTSHFLYNWKMSWTRSSWNITRCARGYYLFQLLLELHGPHDDGTPHRVLHALHVGVHAVQGEHFSEARVPIYRALRHVCTVTGVFQRLKGKGKKIKLEERSRVDKRDGWRLSDFTSRSKTKTSSGSVELGVGLVFALTARRLKPPPRPLATPTPAPDWRSAAGSEDAFCPVRN